MQNVMRLVLGATMLVGLAKCSGPSEVTEAALTGVVRTEGLDSKIIAEATVMASNITSPLVTGLDGRFTLPKSKIGDVVTVQVTANGYAPQTRYVNSTGTDRDMLSVTMRPLQNSDVALPQTGEISASFTVSVLDGSATVIIPANSLVDPNGNIAQGTATVNMAYWSYFDYKSSAPLPLLAKAANPCDAPLKLTTYGMADISITQNGAPLAVAQNQTLGLVFAIPAAQQPVISSLVAGGLLAPRFYSGDQNQGLWIEEGNLTDGKLVFDSNAMTMTGQMAHLSTWNLDNSFANVGGCVSGTIVGADGTTPTANQQVRVYFMSRDEVSSFVATTDSNGAYCINTGVNVKATTVSYYVASAADISQSNMCNAMPASCSDCTGASSWLDPNNNAEFCSFCVLRNDAICSDPYNQDINGTGANNIGCAPRPVCNKDSSQSDLYNNCALEVIDGGQFTLLGYSDSCLPQSPVVEIDMCHFCPGTTSVPASCSYVDIRNNDAVTYDGVSTVGGCGDLGITSFVPGTVVAAAQTKALCDPSLTTTKYVGQPCTQGVDTCCPATSNLTCLDLLCVPAQDSNSKLN